MRIIVIVVWRMQKRARRMPAVMVRFDAVLQEAILMLRAVRYPMGAKL